MKDNRRYYKYILIFMIVISFLIFMCYEDPVENLSIMIFSFSVIILIKLIKKNKNISIIKSIAIFLLAYFLVFFVFFIMAYDINENVEIISKKNNETAILMVYSGEAPMYSIDKEMRKILFEKDKGDLILYPYKLYKIKSLYNKLGKSEYKEKTITVHNKLDYLLKDNYDTYLSYLYDNIYLENKILEIVDNGYKRIIIVPIFLNNNEDTKKLQNRILEMELYNHNVKIKYTDTLWSSESLIESYVNLIKLNSNNTKRIGINLIGIDKNINNDIDNSEAIKQSIIFRSKIREKLVEELDIDSSRIKLSWYNNLEPDYINGNNELLEYGISEMLCLVVDPQLNELVRTDIYEKIKNEIEFPDGVNCKVLDGFLMDNNIITEIISRIEYVDIQNWN